jgi:hypothetical protein
MLLQPEVKTIESESSPIEFRIGGRMESEPFLILAGHVDFSY